MESEMQRRDFLKSAPATSPAVATGALAQTPAANHSTSRPESSDMQYRELGKTAERVSAIGMGGYHLGRQSTSDESVNLMHAAIDHGITFMDNCWDYNDGISEVRMGQALRHGYREKVFLMTKFDGRTKVEYNKQLEESLGRLQTDMIDLAQFHEVIRFEDPDRIFAPGGAMEAAVAARTAGKIRYIGFTGHKDPAIHLRMLEIAQTAQLSLRHRADADQRYGRALPLIHAPGDAGSSPARHRRARHEDLRRSLHFAEQHR